jgi:hypothetical protein
LPRLPFYVNASRPGNGSHRSRVVPLDRAEWHCDYRMTPPFSLALNYSALFRTSVLERSLTALRGSLFSAQSLPRAAATVDSPGTASYPGTSSTKAHPAKAGVAKPRVLASSATPFG